LIIMKRGLFSIILIFFLGIGFLKCGSGARADELEEITKELSDLQKSYQQSVEATRPLESELKRLEEEFKNIEKRIKVASEKIKGLEKSIFDREVDLGVKKEILARRVRSFYISSRRSSPLLMLFSSGSAGQVLRDLSYRSAATEQDKKFIVEVSMNLIALAEDKVKVEKDKERLAVLQKKVDEQAAFFRKEVKNAKAYQEDLSQKITELSARQRTLLEEKTGTFQTSVGDVPLADDPASRPDYNPGFSPAFAAFSFGAPHRKGMSQYGALGRSKAGQGAEQILKSYYGDIRIENKDLPAEIDTTVGKLNFEDNYMKGIAEMPSSWAGEGGMEALKAQAIAARSYAAVAGKPICVTEACQVYKSSKVGDSAAAAWHQAVGETRGKVVVSNGTGGIISAWYASTSGGYLYSYTSGGHTTPGLWDTTCGSQSCWTGDAYEKRAGSPWFYKGWYKSRSGKTCGRSHPWLTEDEFADILNVILVYSKDKGTVGHLSQLDAGSCWGEEISETWDKSRVREEAARYGGPISRVSSVTTSYSTGGYTSSVSVGTDKGSFSFSGEDFKFGFNLRGPGVIHLKSLLFNIEKK
jgi:peptidoglycan hydrolase CwlO-like protein